MLYAGERQDVTSCVCRKPISEEKCRRSVNSRLPHRASARTRHLSGARVVSKVSMNPDRAQVILSPGNSNCHD